MSKKIYHAKTSAFCVLLFVSMSLSQTLRAGLYPFSATYSGANEVPANASTATGTIVGVYNDVTNTIFYTINFSGLGSNVTAAHFHAPAMPGVNAPVVVAHAGFPTGVTSGTYFKSDVLTDVQEASLLAGLMYSNIHTTLLPGGEIRTQIVLGPVSTLIYSFSRTYSGANEVPPNASPATGTIVGVYNSVNNTIFYTINFSGLGSNVTAAHFHTPATPGVNAPVIIGHAGFPTGVTSSTYSKADVLTDGQETNLLAGLFYSNIHTTLLPGGEIRTQIFFDAPFVAPALTCANIVTTTNANLCTRLFPFAATVSGSPAPVVTYRIGTTVITSPHTFPLGVTTISVTAINGGGFATCSFTVTVTDNQAPTIGGLGADPNELWPPNHKMKDVTVNYTSSDNCPGAITCAITVSSDEAQSGTGNGDASPDWEIIDNHKVKLRAERAGKGDGRVYTISVRCTDANGNVSTETTTVTVPHDMSSAPNLNTIFINEDDPAGATVVKVLPNPSRSYFTLNIASGSTEKISVRLIDVTGRVVEVKNNISGTQALRIGNSLKAGIYIAEVRQGNSARQIKLIKSE